MINGDDCRRKSNEFLRAAICAAEPDESQSWLQLSDAWLMLAEQFDKRPVLLEQGRIVTSQMGDNLRDRLGLRVPPISTPRHLASSGGHDDAG